MTRLDEYIGQVLSEVARARMQGDVESIRLADLYASHELLVHFPVPRFRLLNVKLEIPVAIRSARSEMVQAEPAHAEAARHDVESEPLHSELQPSVVIDALRGRLKSAGVTLDASVVRAAEDAVRNRLNTFKRHDSVPASATRVAEDLTAALATVLPATNEHEKSERAALLGQFKEAIRSRLLKFQPEPTHIEVITDTAQLRELGPADLLTRISLTLVEEGMEWKQSDAGTEADRSRLRPE